MSTTLREAQLATSGRSVSKSYLIPPSHKWPTTLNFGNTRPEPGVIAIVLPRGVVAVWEGHSWRRVALSDWGKAYLEPINRRLQPYAVVQFEQLTEKSGNARTIQYMCSEGLATQLLLAPWHVSLARILQWILDS